MPRMGRSSRIMPALLRIAAWAGTRTMRCAGLQRVRIIRSAAGPSMPQLSKETMANWQCRSRRSRRSRRPREPFGIAMAAPSESGRVWQTRPIHSRKRMHEMAEQARRLVLKGFIPATHPCIQEPLFTSGKARDKERAKRLPRKPRIRLKR